MCRVADDTANCKLVSGPPTLLLKMGDYHADGTQEEICSDAHWKYALSPVTFNSIYGGESYDARLEQRDGTLLLSMILPGNRW